MKKIFTILVLFFVFVSVVYAGTLGSGPVDQYGKVLPGWNNMGSGWWHNGVYYSNLDGSIQAYTSNEFGALMTSAVLATVSIPTVPADVATGCTGFETTANCHPEWTESLSYCLSGTLGISGPNTCALDPIKQPDVAKVQPNVSICSATRMDGACKPERVNIYAANTVAKQAEILLTQKGYTASCGVTTAGFLGNVDPNTNLTYYHNSLCTINGQSGFSAAGIVNGAKTDPSLKSIETELKSLEASKICGGIEKVFFNSDGTYKCITTSTSVTPGTPTTPSIPTTSGTQTGTSGTTVASVATIQMTDYIKSMLNKALGQLAELQNQLNLQLSQQGLSSPTTVTPNTLQSSTQTQGISTGDTTTQLTDYLTAMLNKATSQLADLQSQLDTQTSQTGTISQPIPDTSVYVTVDPNDPNAKCTGYETSENCHPEWAISAGNCVVGSINIAMNTCQPNPMIAPDLAKVFPLVSICSATNMGGGCKPGRVNIYGANTIAREHEASSGGTQTCKIQQVSMMGNLDPNTNLPYYYNIVCSSPVAGSPSVNLWMEGQDLQKFASFSVGDTIKYHFTMENVDSVSSYYSAYPGDTCVGGSSQGEQKPWVINSVSPFGVETAVAQQCQAGSSYVISLVGTNTSTGKVAVSTISVYIKP